MDLCLQQKSCRVPGGRNLDELLDTLMTGTNTWSKVPDDRFNGSAFYHPDPNRRGQFNSQGGHFIDTDIKKFDAPFFNLSVAEANAMDPQQRQLLEVSYEALETAGLSLESVSGSNMGVFASSATPSSLSLAEQDIQASSMFVASATPQVMLANRISYTFNLHGPSFIVDTACSTGMTALHLAVQDLQRGGCESAIVAASHLITTPDNWMSLSTLGLHSNSGKCFSYDDRAKSGYGRGEGTVAIVLKPLGAAVQDCDPIRAVIRGTGINQNGKRAGGLTAPSIDAQAALIRETYRKAHMALSDADFIEGHGTGTGVGDPIEIQALGRTFGAAAASKKILLGAVKSNIGHLETASGLASIAKSVLMLEKKLFFPNADFEEENTRYPPSKYNLQVCSYLQPWRSEDNKPRTISINSSGFGGANAHAILQQYIPGPQDIMASVNGEDETRLARYVREAKNLNGVPTPPSDTDAHSETASGAKVLATQVGVSAEKNVLEKAGAFKEFARYRLFVLSARTQQSLDDEVKALNAYMRHEIYEPSFMNNLAYTLGERKSYFPWRAVLLAAQHRDLFYGLQNRTAIRGQAIEEPRLAFVFTGQGAAWALMGCDVHEWSREFRESIRDSEEYLYTFGVKWSLTHELSKSKDESQIMTAELSQTLTTCVQIALVDMLAAWRIRPGVVTGHSSGEIAAAYAANALSRESCVKLAYFRGLAAAELCKEPSKQKGGMLALGVGPEEAESIITRVKNGQLVVACINSPESVTLSGDIDAIHSAKELANGAGKFARLLKVDVAYHSHHMKAVKQAYADGIGVIQPSEDASIPFASSLRGRVVSPPELDEKYWIDNLLQPVNFLAGVEQLFSKPCSDRPKWRPNTIIEVGPNPTLRQPALQTIRSTGMKDDPSYLATLKRDESGVESVLKLAAQLIVKGFPISLEAVNDTAGHGVPQVLHDLPTYPWMHNTDYIVHSRLAENRLFQKHSPHDLLGQLTPESTPLRMTWRNVLNVGSMVPWLAGHRLEGDIVFPGACYVSMVIEAKHRSCAAASPYKAITVRDVRFSAALLLEESQDVELLTYLSPYQAEFGYSSDWDQFEILSWTKSKGYTQHCQGLISEHLEEPPQLSPESIQRSAYAGHDAFCTTPMEYYSLKGIGDTLGGVFRPLSDLRCNPPLSKGCIHALDTASTMPQSAESDYIIHPTVLDGCFQVSSGVPILQGSGAIIPKGIQLLTVASSDHSRFRKKLAVQAVADASKEIYGDRRFRFQGVSETEGITRTSIVAEGVEFTVFEPRSNVDEKTEALKCIAYTTPVWQPIVSTLSRAQAKDKFFRPLLAAASDMEWQRDIHTAAYLFLESAIKTVPFSQIPEGATHLHKFYRWAEEQCKQIEEGHDSKVDEKWSRAPQEVRSQLLEKVRSMDEYGDFLYHVGENAPRVLIGEADAVSVMVDQNRLGKMYVNHRRLQRLYEVAASYMDVLSHQNPNMRIIEVGGGTGGVTLPILEKLQDTADPPCARFNEYLFTDISAGFFDNAQSKFGRLGSKLTYKVMDVEKSPFDQGFETGCYDLLIASNVLHATADIRRTLNNVRPLLRPGGVLLLLESSRFFLPDFSFAMTPGWWLSTDGDPAGVAGEPFRCTGPTMTDEQWHEILVQTGFIGGVQTCIPDYDNPEQHQMSFLISKLPENIITQSSLDVVVAYHGSEVAKESPALESALQNLTGTSPKVIPFGFLQRSHLAKSLCIILDDSEHGILYQPDEILFDSLQALTAAESILWITRGARSGKPTMHMASGFANALRNELPAMQVITLDLDSNSSFSDDRTINLIGTIVEKCIMSENTELSSEVEFQEQDGILFVPRLVKDSGTVDLLCEKPAEMESQDPFSMARTQIVNFANRGVPDSFYFAEDSRSYEELKPDEVEIEPKVFGLNFRAVLIALGQMPGFMSFDTSGVVRQVGSNVTDLKPGDRICTVAELSTGPRVRAGSTIPIPDSVSYDVAATLMTAHCTAYYALIDAGNLQAGESILIHAGAGSLGQSAISVANMLGATVYTTVSTAEKADLLVNEYGVPRNNIFNSRTTAFKDDLMAATNGKGVDVVLNCLAGDLLRLSWECVAPFGRFLEVGKKDILANSRIGMSQLLKNITMRAVDLAQVYDEKPELFGRLVRTVLSLVSEGRLKTPIPIAKYGLAELPKAIRLLGSGKTMGKLVIDVDSRQEVMVQTPPPKGLTLRENASYLITGGTGGIGMATCRHLARRGAKSVILLSRSGGKKDQILKLVEELEQLGTRVTIMKCDVGSREELAEAIQACEQELPPIHGIVHGAMHLQNRYFDGMTCNFFMEHIRPKVHCARNLTELFSGRPLDFLVFLSSAAGLRGSHGQTPYTSTSTFLDGYAYHLREHGIPATVIDIGVVSEVGYVVKQSEDVQKRLMNYHAGFHLNEQNVVGVIDAAMQLRLGTDGQGVQCVAGMIVDAGVTEDSPYSTPKFSHLKKLHAELVQQNASAVTAGPEGGLKGAPLRNRLAAAHASSDPKAIFEVTMDGLMEKLSRVMMIPREDLLPHKQLRDYGFDSLVSAEVRYWLTKELKVDISMPVLLGFPTIEALVERIVETSPLCAKKEEMA
ncbi:MAG: Type I Iterative PKS [Bathelium mastoideum]|nr:MAG: Type I Iterative PKS [Bathelium mastoideum]